MSPLVLNEEKTANFEEQAEVAINRHLTVKWRTDGALCRPWSFPQLLSYRNNEAINKIHLYFAEYGSHT